MNNSEMDMAGMAERLFYATDEEFAEFFMWLNKFRNPLIHNTSELTKNDFQKTDIEEIVSYIKNALYEIIPSDSECCQSMWWKPKKLFKVKLTQIDKDGNTTGEAVLTRDYDSMAKAIWDAHDNLLSENSLIEIRKYDAKKVNVISFGKDDTGVVVYTHNAALEK